MRDLKAIVRAKIASIGVKAASKFYGVSIGTISNWSTGKTPPSVDAVELTLSQMPDLYGKSNSDMTMWEGREVAMLLPVYRSFNPDTHFTLFANYMQYGPQKIAMPKPVKGTCIWEARNILMDKGLGISSAKYFLMCDDDMIVPFGYPDHFNQYFGSNLPANLAGENAISRIMSHPYECGIIGSNYFGRHDKGHAQCAYGFQTSGVEDERLHRLEYSGLVPMDWVGTGFIRISRWVIEKMKAAIDGGMWPDCKPVAQDRWYGYFQPSHVGVGEDVSFCLRAKELGITSYLDASLVCLHNGERNYGPHNTKP